MALEGGYFQPSEDAKTTSVWELSIIEGSFGLVPLQAKIAVGGSEGKHLNFLNSKSNS